MTGDTFLQRAYREPRFRFLVAGSSAAALNWLLRFPIEYVLPYAAAVALATALSMVYGFFVYRHWVFAGSHRSMHRQVRDFILVNFAAMIITVLISVQARGSFEELGMSDWLSRSLAHATGIAGGAIGNYVGHRWITFR